MGAAKSRLIREDRKPVNIWRSIMTMIVEAHLVGPTSMTPELEYLQVKWAAHLSCATATRLLSEVLPVGRYHFDQWREAPCARRRCSSGTELLARMPKHTQTCRAVRCWRRRPVLDSLRGLLTPGGCDTASRRVRDWFHIAMEFRAIEQTARKYPDRVTPTGRGLCEEIASCK